MKHWRGVANAFHRIPEAVDMGPCQSNGGQRGFPSSSQGSNICRSANILLYPSTWRASNLKLYHLSSWISVPAFDPPITYNLVARCWAEIMQRKSKVRSALKRGSNLKMSHWQSFWFSLSIGCNLRLSGVWTAFRVESKATTSLEIHRCFFMEGSRSSTGRDSFIDDFFLHLLQEALNIYTPQDHVLTIKIRWTMQNSRLDIIFLKVLGTISIVRVFLLRMQCLISRLLWWWLGVCKIWR